MTVILSNLTSSPHPHISPLMSPLLYLVAGDIVLNLFFKTIDVRGQEHLPTSGPVLLAPTHRSRWDALLIPYIAGRPVTGRDLYFMVSHDEMEGLQGWIISNFGGFPVNTTHPSISTLRTGVNLLKAGEALVVFPEGNIFRQPHVQNLKPGLTRLAIQATLARPTPDVQIVPIAFHYSQPFPQWGSQVRIDIGPALLTHRYDLDHPKKAAQDLLVDLRQALEELHPLAPIACPA